MSTLVESIDIDGVEVGITKGWWVLDATPLLDFFATRGQNLVIPGIDGQRAYSTRVDQQVVTLQMTVSGEYDPIEDEPFADSLAGLITNLDYLRENVARPPSAPDPTRTLTAVLIDGSTRTAEVQVRMALGTRSEQFCDAVLALTIPVGELAVALGS